MNEKNKAGKTEGICPSMRINKRHRRAISLQILLVSLLLIVVFVLGLLIPLRPSVSELEKRELTKFPKFTLSGMLDGSYFSELELWYADTFPMREWLLGLDGSFEALFGIKDEQLIGTPIDDDEIPIVETDKGGFDWMELPPTAGTYVPPTPTTVSPVTETTSPVITTGGLSSGDLSTAPVTNAPVTNAPVTQAPPVTEAPATQAPGQSDSPNTEPEKHGSIYLVGDTAYELYAFNRKSTDRYISAINRLADRLDGKATVYPIVAPLSYGIILSESEQSRLGLTDQNQALIYMYSNMNDNVKKVYTYSNLLAHKNEYLYFRSDHHWTALGAYYAYESFCAQKGIAPHPLSAFEKATYDGFLGTLYASCGSPIALKKNPDTVIAYRPMGTNKITCYQKDGNVLNWNIITNVSSWNAASKYSTFIGGDNPYSVIHNPDIKDGSACVVVKNSYGNAFVPFMADHYEYVYVVDFRYYDAWTERYNEGISFADLIEQKNIKDVLIVTNIIATGTDGMLDQMSSMFEK